MQSDSIKELAGALAKAQAAMRFAKKDSRNPHFQSDYADLASVWDACREHLTTNGLSVSQILDRDVDGKPCLRTMLMHSSGEWLVSEYPLLGDISRPQVLGSLLTYARRYSLAGIVGIAQDDDDGNAAQQHADQRRREDRPPRQPELAARQTESYGDWLKRAVDAANQKWVAESGSSDSLISSVFQLNRHLLKALAILPGMSERDNMATGADAWRGNREAMESEARAYVRTKLKEGRAKLAPREPGADDMPSPDEEAALDRIAASGRAS